MDKIGARTRFGLVFSINIYPLTIAVRYPYKMGKSHCPLDLTYITAYSFQKKWKNVSFPFGVD